MTKNSFLHPTDEVHFGTYKPEDLKQALKTAIELADGRTKAIIAIPFKSRTYENTIQALSDSTDELEFIAGIVGHLSGVIGDPWHDHDEYISEKATAFLSKRALSTKLYKAVKSIQTNQKALKLSTAKKRLVDDSVLSFERNGIALPTDQKKRLKALQTRAAKLSSKFGRNVSDASDRAHLVVKTPAELSGVNPELVAEWKDTAKEKKVDGYYIQYSPPNVEAILVTCDVEETRLAMQKVSVSRAPENEPLIQEIIALRIELADLLGYKNYVDYVVEQRMAKNSIRIQKFVKDLTGHYHAAMERESKELRDFIRTNENNALYELKPTDVLSGMPLYHASKMRSQTLGVDENEIREYLSLDNVLDGLFETLNTLYGLVVKPADLPTAHKDVTSYFLYDEKGRHISTVWCDWFARKGKRGGAWCHAMYIADRNNDKVDKPHLGFVNANFQPPTKTKPSLLSIRDAETIWHEFGHFIHVSLGKTELREHNGYHTMWDFVEAPSQIMENWIWTDEILARITKHYKTGKSLPAATIKKLQNSRNFRVASRVMWTLYWTAVDQALHTDYKPSDKNSAIDFAQKIRSNYVTIPVPTYDSTICTMLHIFAGGYDAAYYSYLWAEVIEADLFSRFQKEGVLNPKTGRSYRDEVLARGGEADPDVLIHDFLGRDTSPDAMLKRTGTK